MSVNGHSVNGHSVNGHSVNGHSVGNGGNKTNKRSLVSRYSNIRRASRQTRRYLGPNATLHLSTKTNKKYMIQTPSGKWVHFGEIGYEDYTKHRDRRRRANYLTRSGKIRGHWKQDKYSPNQLARNILW
jgi:hypothetical protein